MSGPARRKRAELSLGAAGISAILWRIRTFCPGWKALAPYPFPGTVLPRTLCLSQAVSSEEEREMPVEETAFALLEGEWVYQVTAEWTSRSRWGGSVQYAFLGVS